MTKRLGFAAILAGLMPVLASAVMALFPAFVWAEDSTLQNGIYLVMRDAENSKSLEPASTNERILIDDGHLLEPTQPNLPDKPRFVALRTDHFIPIILAQKPTKKLDAQGTRENCGRSVAIVIGNQVVTVHKVREPIVGGKMQITRCTDNGCDVLYTQLQGAEDKSR